MRDHEGHDRPRRAADPAHRGRRGPRGRRAGRRVGLSDPARPTRSFDHVDLVVSSLETSHAFYRDLLAPLGWRPAGTIVGERGEEVRYLESSAGGELGLRARRSEPGPFDRYALGIHHLAFRAPSRAVVDERAQWLRRRGTEIESGPKEYDYTPGYYAIFLYDPDGLKLEIVHRRED